MKILVIHGPNLDRLGSREPSVYGDQTLESLNGDIGQEAAALGLDVEIVQTAREGEIIERMHAAVDSTSGAVLNPAAYAHTSRAIADAIRGVPYPVIEVHLSNIHAREPWRRRSVTAEAADGIVSGFGPGSYLAALRLLKDMVS